jgi:hypothetical protein
MNVYAKPTVGTQRAGTNGYDTTALQRPANAQPDAAASGDERQSIADAIKQDASARLAQINSSQAPDGVDQDLWSVLTKDERTFFMKAGGMGALTYGRFSQTSATAAVPTMRGGRLDVRA